MPGPYSAAHCVGAVHLVGGGVPDAPQAARAARGIVGRPALWPPRRGQDPSLRYKPEKGDSVRPRAGHARPLQRGAMCRGRRPRRPAGGTRFPGGRRAAASSTPRRAARTTREVVGRPAHRPPRRGQDPSLRCKPEKGDAVRPRAAYMPPLQSGRKSTPLNFIKFTLIKPNF